MTNLADRIALQFPPGAHVDIFDRLAEYASTYAPIKTVIQESEQPPNFPRIQLYRELRVPDSPLSVAVQDLQVQYSNAHWEAHRHAQVQFKHHPYMSASKIIGGMRDAEPVRQGCWTFDFVQSLEEILPEVRKFHEYFA